MESRLSEQPRNKALQRSDRVWSILTSTFGTSVSAGNTHGLFALRPSLR
jgi:hypothetical protein